MRSRRALAVADMALKTIVFVIVWTRPPATKSFINEVCIPLFQPRCAPDMIEARRPGSTKLRVKLDPQAQVYKLGNVP